MGIVLFAIIGAQIQAGVGYWVCYGAYCAIQLGRAIYKTIKEATE